MSKVSYLIFKMIFEMITINKLKLYEKYHGLYDGYYLEHVKNGTNIISDNEWYLIKSLIQDIVMRMKNLTSNEFNSLLEIKIKNNCFDHSTIEEIKRIAYDSISWSNYPPTL